MENLTNITIKLPAKDWQKMAELYGKNRAWKIRIAIKELIKKAEKKSNNEENNNTSNNTNSTDSDIGKMD